VDERAALVALARHPSVLANVAALGDVVRFGALIAVTSLANPKTLIADSGTRL
jgi:hypothetical protein